MGGISKKIIDISVFQNHNEQLLQRVDSWVLTDKQFLVNVCNVFCTLNVFCCLQKRVLIKMGNLNDKFAMCIQRCMLILHDLSCNGCIINKKNSQKVFSSLTRKTFNTFQHSDLRNKVLMREKLYLLSGSDSFKIHLHSFTRNSR